MKRLFSILFFAIFAVGAHAAEGNFDNVSTSCSAVTVTGVCGEFNVHPPDYVHIPSVESFTWQTIISGGTATTVSVTLQGSIDDVTWSTLDTSTSTSGETRTKATAAMKFFRCNVGTYNRNGTTLTCNIMPTRTTGGGGAPSDGSVVNSSVATGAITDDKASLSVKPSAGLVATSNLTLSGAQTIDGILGTSGTTLVLATAQSTASQNGPWVMQSGAWTRPSWYPAGGTSQAIQFSTMFVRLGTVYQGSVWRMTTSGAITIDTDSTAWAVTPLAPQMYAVVATDGTGNYKATGTADQTPINNAISAVSAAGGGTVFLKQGTYTLSASIVPKNNVKLIGVSPGLTGFDSQSDDYWTFDGTGTLLRGDGTFAAISYNATPSSTPSAYSTANSLAYAGFENLGFYNFSRAFDIGSQDNPGLYFGTLRNIYVSSCTQWGLHFENFSESLFEKVFTVSNTVGDMWFAATVNQANYQPGNSSFIQLYSSPLNNLARGIVFAAPGAESNSKSSLNSIKAVDLQVNRFRDTLTTQTITPTNSSTSISVTDLTKFLVGMPFWVTATLDGYTANQTYFILTVSGSSGAGTITAATSPTGTAITASAGTALTLNSYGFANLETVGSSSTVTPSAVIGSSFTGMDLESNSSGGSSALILAERGTNLKFSTPAATFSGGQAAFVFRTTTSTTLDDNHQLPADIDSTSSNFLWNGARSTMQQRTPRGIYLDSTLSVWALSLGQPSGNNPDLYVRSPSGGVFWYPAVGIGEQINTRDTTLTMTPNFCGGVTTFNGAAGQTLTLPAIDNASTKGTSLQGCHIKIVNASTTNTLAIATSSSQTLNNVAAKTTTTMAVNSILELTAATTGSGSVLYWVAIYTPASAVP